MSDDLRERIETELGEKFPNILQVYYRKDEPNERYRDISYDVYETVANFVLSELRRMEAWVKAGLADRWVEMKGPTYGKAVEAYEALVADYIKKMEG